MESAPGAGPVIGSRAGLVPDISFPPPVKGISKLPTGFPPILDSPMAWSGCQSTSNPSYIFFLGDSQVRELELALAQFKTLGLDGDLISRHNFLLPTLGSTFDQIRWELHHGRGFGLIRGLDPQRYSTEDLVMLYLGIQSYIANRQGRQDEKGNMLVHIVADSSSQEKAAHHRHSNSSITFHTEEAGDIIGWLTRSTAAEGGKCVISSAHTVYNLMAASRPDLVRALARSDWPFALPHFHCRPVLFYHDGRLIINFGRAALMGSKSHARAEGLPKLTPTQIEAIDMVEKIAKRAQLEIITQAGDLHFINNLVVLHRRQAFVDGDCRQQRRHLVRLRLRDDEMGWSIPPQLEPEWSRAFGPGRKKVWHPEPMPDGFFPLRSQPN